jgi:hypothetical protein
MLELVYIYRLDYLARNRPPELTVTERELMVRPEVGGRVKRTSTPGSEEGQMTRRSFWRLCRGAFASKHSHV